MGGEDKAALPWLAKHARNPIPDRVVWKQTGTVHDRSYWLAVPPNTALPDALIVAKRDGQNFDITPKYAPAQLSSLSYPVKGVKREESYSILLPGTFLM